MERSASHTTRPNGSEWLEQLLQREAKKAEAYGSDLIVPFLEEDETEEEKANACQILEVCHKVESEQENEDTEMLIRLIKIRKHLWT